MPFIPSLAAVATYAALKVGGYSAFGFGLNRIRERQVWPLGFGLTKTGCGLVGGLVYVLALAPAAGLDRGGFLPLFLGAIPIRLLAWGVVLHIFYDFRSDPRRLSLVAVVGTLWAYALDGLMAWLGQILPGMSRPFC